MAKKKLKNKSFPSAASVAPKAPGERSGGPVLWGILALALTIRVAYLLLSRRSPFFEPMLLDPAYYHQWAMRVASGQIGTEGVFYGLPLYPYFLGVVYKVSGASLVVTKCVQMLLGIVALFFVWKTTGKIASRGAAIFATLLGACYGPLFFQEGILTPEALAVPLYAAAFYAACVYIEAPSVRRGLCTGALFGLSALTKAGIFPFVFIFIAISAVRLRRAGKGFWPAVACAALFVAVLAPVTLHNFIRGKDHVLLTSHAGLNFYIGNNPEAEGVFKAPEGTGSNVDAQIQDSRIAAERALGRPLKPSEVSKYWSDRGWEWIRGNPGKFLKLSAVKLLLFFDRREISDIDDYSFSKKFNPMLRFPWPDFSLLGPLVLLGLFLAASGQARHRGLILTWVAGYLGGLILFFINARYRLPLLGVFFPLAGLALYETLRRLRAREWGRVAVYALILAAGAGLTRLGLVAPDRSRDEVNAGDIYLMKNDPARAMDFYREALSIKPDSAKANLAMGIALTKSGRNEEAKDYYLKAIEIDPKFSLAYNNVGLWYDSKGDLGEAERYFLRAIELNPNSPQAFNNLGMVYGKQGENEKALEYFERSIALSPPGSARVLTNAGLVLYRLGRRREALEHWEAAVRVDPSFGEARKALQALNHS